MNKRVVIKVGSAVLTQNGELALERLKNLVEFIVKLQQKYQVVLVSSGAVAAGYTLVKLDKTIVANKQALASLGQPLLMKTYKEEFAKHNIFCAQVLLEASIFNDETRLKNMQNALDVMLKNNIVPIVNENDVTAIEELVFGDNDQLAAYLTYYIDADLLTILTDIDGYYDDNPQINKNAIMQKNIQYIEPKLLEAKSTSNSQFATGGIVTKLKAADFLMNHKKNMFLTSGFDLKYIKSYLLENKYIKGTLFEGTK